MSIDPEGRLGRGGDVGPGLPPFTADHTPNPGATTSITGELTGLPPSGEPETSLGAALPEVTSPSAALTFAAPSPDDDPERTIAPPSTGAYVPGEALVPGTKLGTRYTVLKTLGRGGMGAVYQAYDDELGVAVAIKTILQGDGSDAHTLRDQVTRFKSELLLARQVTHKNVVRIHDLGEFSGLKYITMSYVAGETLAALLGREGPLPVPTVLALARQIVDGMAAAHEVGVVHRDMKPENVMVTPDGQALIMDFGIASSSQGGSKDGGPIVGTISFMAPEQARGQAVDARADIYAFGLVLYDLLLGRTRQKRHATAMEELRSRFDAAPPPIRSRRPPIGIQTPRRCATRSPR